MAGYLKSLSILVLPISPFASLLMGLLRVPFKSEESSNRLVIFLLSFLLGIINAGKVIESDLILYSKQFELASNTSVVEYLILNFKDPVYYFLNYVINNFVSDNFQIFIFLFSVISYSFLLSATHLFCKAMGLSSSQAIIPILITALSPQIFSFSAHLLRQFLAVSIGFYATAKYLFSSQKKVPILLLFVSILAHSSNLVFISFFLIDLDFKKIMVWGLFSIPIIVAVYVFMNSGSVLVNGFLRINNLEAGAQLEPVGFIVFVFVGLFAVFNFVLNRYLTNCLTEKVLFDKMFWIISGLFFFFALSNNTEISNRLLPILYFFIPIIISLFVKELKISFTSRVCIIGCFILLFCYNLFYGTWSYENMTALFFLPLSF